MNEKAKVFGVFFISLLIFASFYSQAIINVKAYEDYETPFFLTTSCSEGLSRGYIRFLSFSSPDLWYIVEEDSYTPIAFDCVLDSVQTSLKYNTVNDTCSVGIGIRFENDSYDWEYINYAPFETGLKSIENIDLSLSFGDYIFGFVASGETEKKETIEVNCINANFERNCYFMLTSGNILILENEATCYLSFSCSNEWYLTAQKAYSYTYMPFESIARMFVIYVSKNTLDDTTEIHLMENDDSITEHEFEAEETGIAQTIFVNHVIDENNTLYIKVITSGEGYIRIPSITLSIEVIENQCMIETGDIARGITGDNPRVLSFSCPCPRYETFSNEVAQCTFTPNSYMIIRIGAYVYGNSLDGSLAIRVCGVGKGCCGLCWSDFQIYFDAHESGYKTAIIEYPYSAIEENELIYVLIWTCYSESGQYKLNSFTIVLEKPYNNDERYMRKETHSINGLTAYQLNKTQGSTQKCEEVGIGGSVTAYFYAKISVKHANESETLIQDYFQLFNRTNDGSGYQEKEWNCSDTELAYTDALLVRIKIKVSGTDKIVEFITEQLEAESLDSTTWTFNIYTYRLYALGYTYAGIYFGKDAYNSKIENIKYHISW